MTSTTYLKGLYHAFSKRPNGPSTDSKHLSTTVEWLFRSQDVTNCGGSAAYYSLLTGWNEPYPETSGYIIPTLYDYADYADFSEASNRAERMAEWLLTTQLDSGAFPGGTYPDSSPKPSVFNTGQIILGLVRAYRETADEAYLYALEEAGEWLVDIQHSDGYWDRFDYRGERHSYCSRVAWALLKVYEITENNEVRNAAVSHLEWVVSVQTETGWFEYSAFSPDETPYLHTLAYTVRGLLEGGLFLQNDEFISVAKTAADRLLQCHKQTGMLQGAYDRNWEGSDFYCLTGNAQAALIWLRLYAHLQETEYLEASRSEIEGIKKTQHLQGPDPVRGAVQGSEPIWGPYMRFRYPNWAAKFLVDCLLVEKTTDCP